jgi:hypothetical protein
MKTCDQVAERIALGESLDAPGDAEVVDLAEHAAACPHCKRLVALPAELAVVKRDADPGMGFAARMTAGAQHRIAVRRQRRYAMGGGLAVAAAAAVAMVMLREPEPASIAYVPPEVFQHLQALEMPQPTPPTQEVDDDVRALVHLADVEHSRHLSAHWGRIEKSLKPYKGVLKGQEP